MTTHSSRQLPQQRTRRPVTMGTVTPQRSWAAIDKLRVGVSHRLVTWLWHVKPGFYKNRVGSYWFIARLLSIKLIFILFFAFIWFCRKYTDRKQGERERRDRTGPELRIKPRSTEYFMGSTRMGSTKWTIDWPFIENIKMNINNKHINEEKQEK